MLLYENNYHKTLGSSLCLVTVLVMWSTRLELPPRSRLWKVYFSVLGSRKKKRLAIGWCPKNDWSRNLFFSRSCKLRCYGLDFIIRAYQTNNTSWSAVLFWAVVKKKGEQKSKGPRDRRMLAILFTRVTWLILPVVICLSQRLSHACLSINNFVLWNCEWLIKSVIVYLIIPYYLDNRGNSRANTC